MNSTTTSVVHYTSFPIYYSPRPRLLNDIPDHLLTLASPIIAYWTLSLFFHFLDLSNWKWLDRYRIHDSEEVSRKNLVTRKDVVVAVLFQQVVQTLLGYVWLEEEASARGVAAAAVVKGLQRWERLMDPVVDVFLGWVNGYAKAGWAESAAGWWIALGVNGKEELMAKAAYFMYWWGVPGFQFFSAIFFIDTWQYFLHRFMHVNKFFYRQIHSWHHRLYIPYAFGSLYNHPVEGFLLDTLGAAMAEWATRMTTRQAMLLFVVSTLKTVDDHCGYNLPFDPLQMFSANNADYHDIHHQAIGIKSNFAQPFFVHWDTLLGTKMTRTEMEQRKKLNAAKSQ